MYRNAGQSWGELNTVHTPKIRVVMKGMRGDGVEGLAGMKENTTEMDRSIAISRSSQSEAHQCLVLPELIDRREHHLVHRHPKPTGAKNAFQ